MKIKKVIRSGFLALIVIIFFLIFVSCTHTQQGTMFGGGLGALAGQAIGGNTTSTLIGTALGAIVGGLFGDQMDQQKGQQQQSSRNYPFYCQGKVIEVPGQYVGGRYVPPHKVCVPE